MRIAVFLILWFLSSGYAIFAGGKAERLGAAILLWIIAGSMLLQLPATGSSVDIHFGGMMMDGVALAACFFLALRINRHWTLWFCAAQLVVFLGYIAHSLLPGEAGLAYGIMIRAPTYIQCSALLLGTSAFHRKEMKRIRNSSLSS